jgi:hypothetical protein
LVDALRPWFPHPTASFEFGGPLWYLRKKS